MTRTVCAVCKGDPGDPEPYVKAGHVVPYAVQSAGCLHVIPGMSKYVYVRRDVSYMIFPAVACSILFLTALIEQKWVLAALELVLLTALGCMYKFRWPA